MLQATIGDDVDFKVRASSEQEVLEQIIADLEWSEDYIWNKKFLMIERERKGRFNKLSVKALLADIYLWKGDYVKCAQYCKEIMDEKMAEYNVIKTAEWREFYTSSTEGSTSSPTLVAVITTI